MTKAKRTKPPEEKEKTEGLKYSEDYRPRSDVKEVVIELGQELAKHFGKEDYKDITLRELENYAHRLGYINFVMKGITFKRHDDPFVTRKLIDKVEFHGESSIPRVTHKSVTYEELYKLMTGEDLKKDESKNNNT